MRRYASDTVRPHTSRPRLPQSDRVSRFPRTGVCGRTVSEAFLRMWTIERACQIQQAAKATGQPLIALPAEVLERTSKMPRQLEPGDPTDRKLFAALLRRVDEIDPSYRT